MGDEFVKIAVLDDEIQAATLHAILEDREIPHTLHSYGSRVFDGIFQTQAGWGHVAAPERFRDELLAAIGEMGPEAGDADADPDADPDAEADAQP